MNKKNVIFLTGLLMLFSTNVFAEEYKWSEIWCTYPSDLQAGDVILNVDAGLHEYLFNKNIYAYPSMNWLLPYSEASFDVISPIWKLPFSFGMYAGAGLSKYTDIMGTGIFSNRTYFQYARTNQILTIGTTMKYHFHLPAESMDVYVGFKAGLNYLTQVYGIYYRNVVYSRWETDIDPIIGFNWLFAKGFGLNCEFGGETWVKAGLSFCFR